MKKIFTMRNIGYMKKFMKKTYDILCNMNPYINDLNNPFFEYVNKCIIDVKKNGFGIVLCKRTN